jgi:hypothetical protein
MSLQAIQYRQRKQAKVLVESLSEESSVPEEKPLL